jgi:DNA-binding Xre family transcriptional regulator
MANPRFITTPGGEEVVLLSKPDYERLAEAAEDLADLAAAERAGNRFESGEAEFLPLDMVRRMVDGESPVRVWREYRGLGVSDLAAKAGISTTHLSEIETGTRDETFSTMARIADALAVELDDLKPQLADD